jgi:superkiller protein 3
MAGLLITVHASAAVRDLPADAERLYNGGLYRQAVEVLNASIQRSPGESSLHYWLGRCLYELRDYNRAISSFEHAVIIEPDLSEYHDWLGKAYGRKAEETNRFSAFSSISLAHKAHREFEAAVRLDAHNLEAQRDLIRYLVNAPAIVGGSQGAAEQRVHTLAAVDSTEGALAQAEVYASHKKFDDASQVYQTILDMMPSRVGVYFEIAEYYRDRGDAPNMSEAVEKAAALAPSDHRLEYYRGIALILAGHSDSDAEKDLRHYLDTVPDNANVPSHSTAHEWLGKLYQRQGQLDRAAEEYQAALIADPRNRQAIDALKALQRRR